EAKVIIPLKKRLLKRDRKLCFHSVADPVLHACRSCGSRTRSVENGDGTDRRKNRNCDIGGVGKSGIKRNCAVKVEVLDHYIQRICTVYATRQPVREKI